MSQAKDPPLCSLSKGGITYSKFLLIRGNSFSEIWWINEFGGLTRFSLALVLVLGNCSGLKDLAVCGGLTRIH